MDNPQVAQIHKGNITLHIFTSPEVGELVNSLIVETPNQLVIVDVPAYKPFAEAFRTHAMSIGKPIAKILITHAHPDHWFSLSHFPEYQTYAFQEAINEMAALKDLAVGYHRSVHPELVPDQVNLPSTVIEAGPLEIDGITFVLHKVFDAEASATMAVEIPAIKTLLAQDLVYNHCYLYVATRTASGEPTIDSWIGHLQSFKKMGFELVVPGHGLPTDASIFDECIAYLTFARDVVATAANGDELIQRFREKYPEYQLEQTLQMSAIMMYPPSA